MTLPKTSADEQQQVAFVGSMHQGARVITQAECLHAVFTDPAGIADMPALNRKCWPLSARHLPDTISIQGKAQGK